MTKIIVDSNILFSAILNTNSRIGQILITGDEFFEFYSPEYIRTEIFEYQDKIKKTASLTNEEFFEIYELFIRRITTLNHSILPLKYLTKAVEYCHDIDIDDAIFVGFSEYLKAKLWTGDKKLIEGLRIKGFKRIITTYELIKEFNKLRI